jgi:hypothetical protein
MAFSYACSITYFRRYANVRIINRKITIFFMGVLLSSLPVLVIVIHIFNKTWIVFSEKRNKVVAEGTISAYFSS